MRQTGVVQFCKGVGRVRTVRRSHAVARPLPDAGADLPAAGMPEGWTARDKFTAVIETAALNEFARSREIETQIATLLEGMTDRY